MKIKGISDESFNDYKLPAMFIAFPSCDFKCDKENGECLCQNSHLAKEDNINISKEELLQRYMKNEITSAIVLGGLEPFDNELDLVSFIDCARHRFQITDPIIIYTGYTENEIEEGKFGTGKPEVQQSCWRAIRTSGNIIVKFGRYRPNQQKHYDEVLGVFLASDNQYAKEYL